MFPLWVPMTSTFQGGSYTHNISQQFHHVTKRLQCPRSKHLLATCIDLYSFKYHHIVSTVLNTPSVLAPWLSLKATSTTHIACCKMQQSTEALKVFWMLCLDQKGVLRCVTKRLHPSFLALKWRWCCVFNNDLHLSQQYSDIIIYIWCILLLHICQNLEHLHSWPKMPKAAKLPPPEKIELLLEGEIISEDGRLPRHGSAQRSMWACHGLFDGACPDMAALMGAVMMKERTLFLDNPCRQFQNFRNTCSILMYSVFQAKNRKQVRWQKGSAERERGIATALEHDREVPVDCVPTTEPRPKVWEEYIQGARRATPCHTMRKMVM